MPELPEVEAASRIAQRVAKGQVIAGVEVLHVAQRRTLPEAAAATLGGDVVRRVTRRAKYQLLHLGSGRTLVVHFRMAGDWSVMRRGAPLPAHARAVLRFASGRALALVDSRALCTVELFPPGVAPLPDLGPEADGDAFTATHLREAVARRSGAIKPLLLDQAIAAGVGNIYASEALWAAKVDPRRRGRALTVAELARVVAGVRRVMRKALAHPERYYQSGSDHLRFNVYDREGAPCRRCRAPIRRVVQAGRSTYWCASCQR